MNCEKIKKPNLPEDAWRGMELVYHKMGLSDEEIAKKMLDHLNCVLEENHGIAKYRQIGLRKAVRGFHLMRWFSPLFSLSSLREEEDCVVEFKEKVYNYGYQINCTNGKVFNVGIRERYPDYFGLWKTYYNIAFDTISEGRPYRITYSPRTMEVIKIGIFAEKHKTLDDVYGPWNSASDKTHYIIRKDETQDKKVETSICKKAGIALLWIVSLIMFMLFFSVLFYMIVRV